MLRSLFLLLFASCVSFGQYLTWVHAGAGPYGVPSSQVRLLNQRAVTLDSAGNPLIATNRQIFRMDKVSGRIVPLIGSLSGALNATATIADGTPALRASFDGIATLAAAPNDDIYFLDQTRNRVYRYQAVNGKLQHFAGAGGNTSGADGPDARLVNLRIRALAVGPLGDVYLAEDYRLRRMDGSSPAIATLCGRNASADSPDGTLIASASLNDVVGVAVDFQRYVYIAERRGNGPGRIRKIVEGRLRTVAGALEGGTALTGTEQSPSTNTTMTIRGMGQEGQAILLVFENTQVIRVNLNTGYSSIVTRVQGPSTFRTLAGDGSGTVYLSGANSILRYAPTDTAGAVTTPVFPTAAFVPSNNQPARGIELPEARYVAVGPDGDLYIAGFGIIRRVRRSDGIAENFYVAQGCFGVPQQPCVSFGALAVDAENRVYAVRPPDPNNPSPSVVRLHNDNSFETVAGGGIHPGFTDVPALAIPFSSPEAIALDRDGRLLVTDRTRCAIWRINLNDHTGSRVAGNGVCGPSPERVPALGSPIDSPTAIAADRYGNTYFLEPTRHRVRRIDEQGMLTTVAGTGLPGFNGESGSPLLTQINNPTGVAVDADGTVYISDRGNARIRRLTADRLTTIAGNGTPGLVPLVTLENGSPVLERTRSTGPTVCVPQHVAVGNDRRVYYADLCNLQVNVIAARLAISSNPPGRLVQYNGTVVQTPAALEPELGSISTVTAVALQSGGLPGSRFRFLNWEGPGGGTDPTVRVPSLVEPATVVANFEEQYPVRAQTSPAGGGKVVLDPPTTDGYYTLGTRVSLTAEPASGFTFSGFSFAEPSNPLQVTVGRSATGVLATFTSNAQGFQPIRINVGGPKIIDPLGQEWLADPALDSGDASNTIVSSTALPPPDPNAAPALYRSARTATGPVGYTLRVPNGNYLVRFKFAELENMLPGQRVLEILIQGQVVRAATDLRVQTGGTGRGLDLTFPAEVTEGTLSVAVNAVAGRPILNALEVLPYGVGVSVLPSRMELPGGARQAFGALVVGTDLTMVTWAVEPALGLISDTGLYTAPDVVTQRQVVQIVATSMADPTRSARAEVVLVPNWQSLNIGQPTVEGTWEFTNGVHQISGNGRILNRTDAFRFVFQPLESDGSITARILPDTRSGALAGLMVRESLDTDSRYVALTLDRNQLVQRTTRTTPGGEPATENGAQGAQWVRLVRKGGWVHGYTSLDGERWIAVGGWSDLGFGGTVQAGMFVSAPTETTTASFDGVRLGNPVAVAIVPGYSTLAAGQAGRFVAEATGAGDASVTWSLTPQLGAVAADGSYVAPADLAGAESVTVTATSVEDPTAQASTVVRLGEFRPIRVKAGGTSFVADDGMTWATDQGFFGGKSDTFRAASNLPRIWATGRASNELFFYRFLVPNGSYRVVLRFAEPENRPPGSRVFSVSMNGTIVLADFDIAAQVGSSGAAADQTFAVQVTGGELLIGFQPTRGRAMVQGIEILP